MNVTKEEFALIALALQEYYPKEKLLQTTEAKKLWFKQLEDIPYKVAEAGIQKWVSLNKWSPTIADIREMSTSVTIGELPDWGQAWQETTRAIRKFGRMRASEALDSLSPLTRQAVERIGFTTLCMSENEIADRAHFEKIYNILAVRKLQEAKLPASLKLETQKLRQQYLLGDGEDWA